MAVVFVSSFGITEINDGGFSAIHLLSVWTLLSLCVGIGAMRFRRHLSQPLRLHLTALQTLYAGGLLTAGALPCCPSGFWAD